MKIEKLLTLVLIISSLSLMLSFFSFIYSYSVLLEINRIRPYIQLPLPQYVSETAIFPEISGRFILATSSLILSLSFLIVGLLLILIFRFRK